VKLLIKAIDELKLNIPMSIKEAGVDEKEFYTNLDQLAENSFNDQCTGANPRYPLINKLKAIYTADFKR